jgi:hypothetical protein
LKQIEKSYLMVRKLLRWIILYGCTAMIWSACSSDDEEVTPVTTEPAMMRVGAVISQFDAEKEGLTLENPMFTFWDASTFLKENGAKPELYFAIEASSLVTSYTSKQDPYGIDESTWYDTGHSYLPNDQTVLLSGYIPARIGSEDHKRLTLEPDMLACNSVWIAKESLLGSTYNPFSRALQFVHATTQINFKAMLAEGMTRSIQDVTLTIPESEVLYRMEWRTQDDGNKLDQCHFSPISYDRATDYEPLSVEVKESLANRLKCHWNEGNLPSYAQVSNGIKEKADLGTFYLRPEQTQVVISVTATMYTEVGNGHPAVASTYKVSKMAIPFGTDADPVTLQSGDKYEITLKFNNVEIELEGRKLPFSNGGNVSIPIQPFLN